MENKEISLEQAIVFLEMNAYEGSNAKAVLRMGDVHEVLKPIKGLIDKSAKMERHIEQLEQALDKACEVIDDITKDNATEFCPATEFNWLPSNCNEHTCENGTKECWKEWALQNRK